MFMRKVLGSLARHQPTMRLAAPVFSQQRWMGGAARQGDFLERPEVTARVLETVKTFDKIEDTKVTDVARFAEDLGLDSLDAVEVVMAFEDEFVIEIPDKDADNILSTKDAIDYIVTHPHAQ